MGNTSCTTKHKIVLSILCGLNKIKIIKTISLSLSLSLSLAHSVCVSVCKGISAVHPLNVVYFLRLVLSWHSIWVSFCVNDFISFFLWLAVKFWYTIILYPQKIQCPSLFFMNTQHITQQSNRWPQPTNQPTPAHTASSSSSSAAWHGQKGGNCSAYIGHGCSKTHGHLIAMWIRPLVVLHMWACVCGRKDWCAPHGNLGLCIEIAHTPSEA